MTTNPTVQSVTKNYLQQKQEQGATDGLAPTKPWSQQHRVSLGLHEETEATEIADSINPRNNPDPNLMLGWSTLKNGAHVHPAELAMLGGHAKYWLIFFFFFLFTAHYDIKSSQWMMVHLLQAPGLVQSGSLSHSHGFLGILKNGAVVNVISHT